MGNTETNAERVELKIPKGEKKYGRGDGEERPDDSQSDFEATVIEVVPLIHSFATMYPNSVQSRKRYHLRQLAGPLLLVFKPVLLEIA
mgnify:CR=1 FL=1